MHFADSADIINLSDKPVPAFGEYSRYSDSNSALEMQARYQKLWMDHNSEIMLNKMKH